MFRRNTIKAAVLRNLAEFFVLRTRDLVELVYNVPYTPHIPRKLARQDPDRYTARKKFNTKAASIRRTLDTLQEEGRVNVLLFSDIDQERGSPSNVAGLTDLAVADFANYAQPSGGYFKAKSFDEHSRRTLDHEIAISLFHLKLKKTCPKPQENLFWQQRDLKRTTHPDAYFAITLPELPPDANTSHYFLEVERGQNKFTSDAYENGQGILRKLARYYELFNTEKSEKEWGFRHFRVILILENEERKLNLIKALQTQLVHESQCRFLIRPKPKNAKCSCTPHTLDHRMFWLATKDDPLTFQTSKDYTTATYSLFDKNF